MKTAETLRGFGELVLEKKNCLACLTVLPEQIKHMVSREEELVEAGANPDQSTGLLGSDLLLTAAVVL